MSGNTITNAVNEQAQVVRIDDYRNDFAAVLPSHVRPDQWVRLTQGVLRRNPKLQNIFRTNTASVLTALLDAARQGLEVGKTYHLVPMGNEVVGIEDYTGVIELMYRAGAIASVKAEIVYERDLEWFDHLDPATGKTVRRQRFEWVPGEMSRPFHSPLWFSDRGKMIGAYAYAEMINGTYSRVVVRSEAEINQVRAVSKTARSADSPWAKWTDRMWLKTVLRELSKFVPTSAEYRHIVAQSVADASERNTVGVVADVSGLRQDNDYLDGEVVDDAKPVPSTRLTA